MAENDGDVVIPVETGSDTDTQTQPTAEEQEVKGVLEKYGIDPATATEREIKLAKEYREIQKHATEQGQLASTLKDVIDGIGEQKKQQTQMGTQGQSQDPEAIRKFWAEKIDDPDPKVRLDAIWTLGRMAGQQEAQQIVGYHIALNSLTPEEKKVMEDAAKRGERISPDTAKLIAKGLGADKTVAQAREDALKDRQPFNAQVETGGHAIPIRGRTPAMDEVNRKAYQKCLDAGLVKNEKEYWDIKGNKSFVGAEIKKQKLQFGGGGT